MRTILSLTALALLAVTAEAETAETEAPTCAEGQAVSFEDLAAAHKAILFGDYHGTQEMPEAFGDAVAVHVRTIGARSEAGCLRDAPLFKLGR